MRVFVSIRLSSFPPQRGGKHHEGCSYLCLQPQRVKVVNESPLNTVLISVIAVRMRGRRRKEGLKVSIKGSKKIPSARIYSFSVIKIKIVLKTGENKQKITKKSNISPEVDKKTQFCVRILI